MSAAPNIHRASTYLLRFDEPQENASPIVQIDDELPSDEPEPEYSRDLHAEENEVHAEYNRLLTAYQEQLQNMELTLSDARREWAENEGRLLAERLTSEIAIAFDSLRSDVARALEPILARKICEMSVSDLTAAIRHAMSDCDRPLLRVEGPKPLIDGFVEAIDQDDISFEVRESDEIDLTVLQQSTSFEARIQEWSATIRKMMEEDR